MQDSDTRALLRADEANQLRMLKAYYERTGGQRNIMPSALHVGAELGMDPEVSKRTYRQLTAAGLLQEKGNGCIAVMTAAGVAEVRRALEEPEGGTGHFTASTIHQVVTVHGNVGAVQAGTGNIATVTQTVGVGGDEIAKILSALRREVEKLDGENAQHAKVIVEQIEEQTKSEKPNLGLIKAFGQSLRAFCTPENFVVLWSHVVHLLGQYGDLASKVF